MVIAVLEDDARRREAMERLLAEHYAAYSTVFFDNAPDMIAWLPGNLPQVALICLDHDLGPNREREGEVFDPGTGRDVVNLLCLFAPSCPVVVHTSNYLAAPGMLLALEEARWEVARAVPFDDLVWLTREWFPIVRDGLDTMTIRLYQETDEEQVVELWQRCGLVTPPNDPREDIQRKLRVQRELFLVGAVGEQIVATVMAGYDGHRGWLYAVAVAPEFQGRGLGRRLVAEAEARLRDRGCTKINLQVRASNKAVVGFYRSLGYVVEEKVSLGKRLE